MRQPRSAPVPNSRLDLTMNVYTDPSLLDVASVLGLLPTLLLTDDTRTAAAR